MKIPRQISIALILLVTAAASGQVSTPPAAALGAASAERFAKLALACVHQEYPNKISHNLNSDADVAPARKLTPAFYGCYDWHSSVHGHWLLARLARVYPDAPFAAPALAALRQSITPENISAEVKYLNGAGRASFERPYGLAWLLQLGMELREWGRANSDAETRRRGDTQSGVKSKATAEGGDADARELAEILRPLEDAAVARLKTWLPKLAHPVRSGEHSQTAFALGLMLDYAKGTGDKAFERLLVDKALEFYLKDVNCPLNYEPSGEDFLSPCLAEADVMRRVLARDEYAKWLLAFLPELGPKKVSTTDWLKPEVVTDPSDPKLAHLDGLNLSRAWMLEGTASGLEGSNTIPLARLRAVAKAHREAGLKSVTGEHYEGGHWLGSFAVYLVTQRGIAHK